MSAVDEIYDAVADDAAYARLPYLLAWATGARSAIMLELGEGMEAQGSVRHAVSNGIMERYASLNLWRHDVWSHLMGRPGYRNRAVRSDEVVDVASFRESVFYNELYRPLGDDTARCLGVVLDRPGGSLAIGLHRAYGQPVYGEADAAALQALVPHLRRLVAARGRLALAEHRAAQMTAAFDEIACGLLILGPSARLHIANRRAEELLRARSGILLERGRVAAGDPLISQRFAEAVRSAAMGQGARGGAMRLRRKDAPPLRVLVVPLTEPRPAALVLLDDEERRETFATILTSLYNLTAGEAEVADLLAQGFSPQEAAVARGVRLSTVRSQILVLLQKTETRGLGDLLRNLGSISRLGSFTRK